MHMTRYATVASLCVGTLLAAASMVNAHHSFSGEWDRGNPVTITGVVTKVEWVNPHIAFLVDVKGRNGKITTWVFFGAAPGGLERRGVPSTAIKVGDAVKVDGFRALNGSTTASCWSVTFSDRKRIFVGPLEDPSLP